MTGNYTISLADFDGLFQDQQNIYLKDNATGTFTDLKISPYVFTTELGIFNSRFELRFDTNLDNTKITQPNSVVVWTDENSISIDSKDKLLEKVEIYDTTGRLIYKNNFNQEFKIYIDTIPSSNQVLFVKITLENGKIINQKIRF